MNSEAMNGTNSDSLQLSAPDATRLGQLAGLLHIRPAILKAGLSIFDQCIVSGTSFVTAIIIGRACPRDELGLYYLTLAITIVLLGIQETVIISPYIVFSARRRGHELAEYTGSAWAHQRIYIGVTMVALTTVAAVLSIVGNSGVVYGLWVLVVVAPLLLLRDAIRRFAFAHLHLATALAIDATVAVLQISGLLLLWYWKQLSIPTIFGVMGGACLIASLGSFLSDRLPSQFVRQRIREDWVDNWSFAKWTVLSYLIVDTIPYLMPWILNLAAGQVATGTFGACATLAGIAGVLVAGVENFLRPKAAKSYSSGGAPALGRLLITAASLFVVVFGTALVVAYFQGEHLAILVYGSSFSGCGMTITVLIANVLVGSMGFISSCGLWAIGQPRASFFADIVMLVTTIAAAVTLVEPYGVLGAAVATLIGTSIGTVLKGATLNTILRSLQPTPHLTGVADSTLVQVN